MNKLRALENLGLDFIQANLYLCSMSLGAEIKKRRRDRGLKQESFARAVGLSKTSISNIENDSQEPGGSALSRIAEALECSVEELTKGDPRFSRPVSGRDLIPESEEELMNQFLSLRFRSPEGLTEEEIGEAAMDVARDVMKRLRDIKKGK